MRLLVVDTRVKHSHSEGEYGKRRAGCEKGAALLGVTRCGTWRTRSWTRPWPAWATRRRCAAWCATS